MADQRGRPRGRANPLRFGKEDPLMKLRVACIYGGRSGEHEISIRSAESIMAAMDPNRYEIIHNAFPMICVLLKPVLRELLSELFEDHRPTNYQLAGEETAFATMLEAKIAAGEMAIEYLPEVFAYEVKCLELTRQVWSGNDPHAEVEFAMEFQHPPDELLPPLSRLTAPPAGLPKGSYRVWVRLQAGRFNVEAA